ncbi:UdgX family uracil-DNA binding protein [Mycolicibacterium pyrenivorans]|uniref:UdgX family uracil-DNA binding protein n=1 Tax=Mycolicibacterium pyrenivorans TaxID=187102 RepID=UPI0021F2BED4|nr:UdgX family uracil-DNA binding protein [Mycolicibacterium pyrenivorans]MCV7153959.1 UdgX family uracil-DNA binding protein [Mycolicibacterium pyrenivorans]
MTGAQEFVPETRRLGTLADAAQRCQGCDLYRDATQVVFGTGPTAARIALVGEQPGDREDIAGRPFVGPAGRLLDKALESAAVDRGTVYLTNAVKHFKFTREGAGKRRIHKTPSRTEVVSCRPWLLAELDAVRPEVVVLLGATAAKSLMGNGFRLTAHRGEVLELPDDSGLARLRARPLVVATAHPSAVLRGPADRREAAFAALVSDLRCAAQALDIQATRV